MIPFVHLFLQALTCSLHYCCFILCGGSFWGILGYLVWYSIWNWNWISSRKGCLYCFFHLAATFLSFQSSGDGTSDVSIWGCYFRQICICDTKIIILLNLWSQQIDTLPSMYLRSNVCVRTIVCHMFCLLHQRHLLMNLALGKIATERFWESYNISSSTNKSIHNSPRKKSKWITHSIECITNITC